MVRPAASMVQERSWRRVRIPRRSTLAARPPGEKRAPLEGPAARVRMPGRRVTRFRVLSGPPRVLAVAGLAATGLYAVLAALGDLRAHLTAYLALHGALFVLYAFASRAVLARGSAEPSGGGRVRPGPVVGKESGNGPGHGGEPRRVFALVVFFAALFRLVMIAAPPSLSDDVWRYVWDGRVQAAGHNPYAWPPDAKELEPLRDGGWSRINHPSIRTVYPPLAEALFLVSAVARGGARGLKLLFACFDIGAILALAALLRKTGRAP